MADIAGFAADSQFDVKIVLVDDARALTSRLRSFAPSRRVVTHPFDRGRPKATLPGIFAERNEIVVTLDDDLQHRP